MSEYKPTTRQIKEVYSAAEGNYVGILALRTAEFDRWLASVKAEAWDEGYTRSVSDLIGFESDGSTTVNPYREESK